MTSRARTRRPCMIIFIRNGAWYLPPAIPPLTWAGASPGTTIPRQESRTR